MLIGITDNMGSEQKYQRYTDWLRRGDPTVRWQRLSYKSKNLADMERCDALLLTGGNDVDPVLYGGDRRHPKITSVDRKRDDFERALIDRAIDHWRPILGICRGMQIVNVHFGGSLIPDLVEAGYHLHRNEDKLECWHGVSTEQTNLLPDASRAKKGTVNSSHHQAVGTVGEGLRVIARAEDGIIEGLEKIDNDAAFFLLVQWHPERMDDFENPLCVEVLNNFLSSIKRTENIHLKNRT